MRTIAPWRDPLRVVVVGLDGGTFDLIEPWVEAGLLPTFQRLMSEGAWGRLRSTMPPITAPAWSSFITGKNPGRHGLIDFVFRRPGSYQVSPVNASLRQGRSLWSLLGQGGKSVTVVNVPMTYPPEPVNGQMITGLLTPSERSEFTYPPELADDLRARGYRIHAPQSYARGNIERFLEAVYETTDIQLDTLRRLMEQHDPDFAMYVFRGTDRMQHGLWHFMDAGHPLHGAPGTERYRDAIREHYQYIDRQLDELLARLDERTVLVLMSDHGAGPFEKYIYMNNWLMRWGFLRLRRSPATWIKRLSFALGLTPITAYNLLLKLGLGGLKGQVTKGKGERTLARWFLSFGDVDWARTRVYSLGNAGQLWINLQGREPMGSVAPGAEYEAVRQEVIARLQEMVDPETGERLVDEIYTREMLFDGPYLEQMPDIAFVPRGFRYLSFGEYEFASHRLLDVSYGITGWHRLEGMVLLHGAPIQAGRHLAGARIEDVAPTVLYLMGQPIPADMDGRVLADALSPAWIDDERLAPVAAGEGTEREHVDWSAEDEEEVRQRLQGLGYLG
ncbi:MAG: alkaline phosphatase family protein [Anaerolineae bacterium]